MKPFWRETRLNRKGAFTRAILHCVLAFRSIIMTPENAQKGESLVLAKWPR